MRCHPLVVCADGFTMSVQANGGAYCSPRVEGAKRYDTVEIGFPSEREDLLMRYCEQRDKPTETVYAYVPAWVVSLVLAKHGGIVKGEVPNGIPYLKVMPP